jgi:hypothetical protein
MRGRWVSQDEPDVSRYVFCSVLSSLEHKKVLQTNHVALAASNGHLNYISSCRINRETTLYRLFMYWFRRQLHLENKIGCCNQMDRMVLALQHVGCGMN